VLFEGGAGETIRRKLLHECDVHTLLRLPTGLFYAQGVKANVIFFDKKPASETAQTRQLWIYDLRTNKHFTLKTNPLKRADLDEFVRLYNPANRHERRATWFDEAGDRPNVDHEPHRDGASTPPPKPSPASQGRGLLPPPPAGEGWRGGERGANGRWRAYSYDELMARDKASLDIFWLKDDSLADSDNLPPPDVIAQEIVEDLEAALEQFRLI
jgi:type I restriction enzyme M protein